MQLQKAPIGITSIFVIGVGLPAPSHTPAASNRTVLLSGVFVKLAALSVLLAQATCGLREPTAASAKMSRTATAICRQRGLMVQHCGMSAIPLPIPSRLL